MTDIKKEASLYRKKHIHGEVTVKSLCDALDELGYTVVFFNAVSNEPEVNVLIEHLNLASLITTQRGFTFANGKYRLVFVNEDLAEEEKLVVLAHETGHVHLRHVTRASIIGNDVIEEHEANEFAHYLLYKSNRIRLIAIISAAAAVVVLTIVFSISRKKSPDPVQLAEMIPEQMTETEEPASSEKKTEVPASTEIRAANTSGTVIDNRGRKNKQNVYGVTFDLPATWGSKKESDNGDFTYFYPDDGMLMIAHRLYDKDDNKLTEADIDGLISGIASSEGGSNFTLTSRSMTSVKSDGRQASMIEFDQTIHDMDLHLYCFTFFNNRDLISFMYADYPYAEEDRTEAFFNVIDSIRFEEEPLDEKTADGKIETSSPAENAEQEETKTNPGSPSTLSQQNAIAAAKNYINFSSFSRNGLIHQLSSEYGDGYPVEDAQFAVEYLESNGLVDWDEQVIKAAKNYLSLSAFSRKGLISQLSSEYGDGYTKEQSEQAVTYLEENDLVDWNEQAVKAAKSYLDFDSFSRAELKDQLTSEYGSGFTEEQAEYALSEVGY